MPIPPTSNAFYPFGGSGPTPARIGKYEVHGEVGRGDAIKVYRAYDNDIGRPVTLKVLADVADPALRKRFRDEVAIVARLRCESVTAIYELGEHVGLPFAAMQVLSDHTLKDAMHDTLLQKVTMMWQIAEGMRAAYLGGLRHVAIRPSGIAVDEHGNGVIRDFGIVRLTPPLEDETFRYGSPEEQSGEIPPDAISDIYSYGISYYELLGGEHPDRECPDALTQLLYRAIDRRRDFRYQSIEELQEDAEPVLRELKRSRTRALLSEARAQMGQERWDEAQAVVREALQLDPDNRETQKLRGDLRSHLQSRNVRPRVAAMVAEAEEHATARRFQRCVELLEAALRLDENDAELKQRLADVRARLEQSSRSATLIEEARAFLERNAFDDARMKASEASEVDPENTDIPVLLRAIHEAVERRDREARVSAGLANAKSLLMAQEFDQATAVLKRLRSEFPDASFIENWLDHVRSQRAEAERYGHLQTKLEEGRALIANHRYHTAILLLADLCTEFPGETQPADLLDQACQARDRESAVIETTVRCDELRAAGQLEEALDTIDAALALYPSEVELLTLRRDVSDQVRSRQSAAEAEKVLQEVRWLLQQDRPNLASQMLAELPSEVASRPEIVKQAEEIARILPDWENRRFVQDTLRRAAELERLDETAGALTVLEEALEKHPGSKELLDNADRLRTSMFGQERRKKLARRIETIANKIAAQSWAPALLLIEAAQAEFPGEPELQALRHKAEEGSKRAEAEAIVAEIRRCLADDEPEQAQRAFEAGAAILRDHPALKDLERELADDRSYREQWRKAQVLFGRGKFQEAEHVLLGLTGTAHPEVEVLLKKVREARDEGEEDHFYAHGREKALRLVQMQEYGQAIDLLRNLLNLFPGDPILERDLKAAMSAAAQQPAPIAPPVLDDEAEEEQVAVLEQPSKALAPVIIEAPPPVEKPPLPIFEPPAPAGVRWKPATGVAAALLVLSGGALWKISKDDVNAAPPTRTPTAATAAPPASVSPAAAVTAPPNAPQHETERTDTTQRSRSKRNAATRRFEPSSLPSASPAQPGAPLLPPAGTVETPRPGAVPGAVAQLMDSRNIPAPPRPEPKPETAPTDAAKPTRTGGTVQQATLISGAPPEMPAVARQQGLSGVVTLEATVNEAGVVTDVKVLNGHAFLAQAAKSAVMKWRYKPALLNGQPISTKVQIKATFNARNP